MTGGSPHYTVLARRYRPQKFDDVVAQQHVAQALRNAIRANPRSPGPYLVLALTFLQREERYPEAVELARLGLQQGPQGRELQLAYFLLADLYNRLGETELETEFARLGASVVLPNGDGR